MTTINDTYTVSGEQITASLLIWRRFRLPTPGLHEALLAANPGLADQGVYVPLGTEVVIPIDTEVDYRATSIRLWNET